MTHWIENIANELSKMDVEEHVIASGTSISGSIHIGNSCDIFVANGIGKKLREKGKKDMDCRRPRPTQKGTIPFT